MPSPRPHCLILADAPGALTSLCGISMIERLLRVVQRLGFEEATVLSHTLAPIREHLERPSWARAEVRLEFLEQETPDARDYCSLGHDRLLVLRGDFYYDARLLAPLSDATETTVLIDSNSKRESGAMLLNCADPISRANLDAAAVPAYVRDQRATIPPVFFPAPSTPEEHRTAECVLQHAAQKGTLDIPAMVHAPIETWIVSKLWSTSIRPNHLSFVTMLVGLAVTALYATGHLAIGVIVALVVGVLDGLDGKLARTKVETTKLGKWEHEADYFVETTWWLALAYHFATTREIPHIWLLWAVLFSCEFIDRATRGWIKKRLDRNLDDFTRFDRLVRLIGARRNIYTWILALGMLFGAPARAFVIICWWGIATAIVHVTRGLQIKYSLGTRPPQRRHRLQPSRAARRDVTSNENGEDSEQGCP